MLVQSKKPTMTCVRYCLLLLALNFGRNNLKILPLSLPFSSPFSFAFFPLYPYYYCFKSQGNNIKPRIHFNKNREWWTCVAGVEFKRKCPWHVGVTCPTSHRAPGNITSMPMTWQDWPFPILPSSFCSANWYRYDLHCYWKGWTANHSSSQTCHWNGMRSHPNVHLHEE